MSGYFTRLSYDPITYNEKISQSTKPIMYKLEPSYATNCKKCLPSYNPYHQIDVDSVLRGLDKNHSKSSICKIPFPLNNYQIPLQFDCDLGTESEYTRFTNPAYDIKGLNVLDMHMDYPLRDPQCNIFEDFQINTRLQAKDNHKAIWHEPLDQTAVLPRSRSKDKNDRYTNYAPIF